MTTKKTRVAALPLMLMGLGMILILSASAWVYYLHATGRPSADPLPESVVALPRAGALYGQEAIDMINRMHIGSFRLSSAAVGVYGDRELTLYVSGLPFSFMAEMTTRAMAEKIATTDTPFALHGSRSRAGRQVYELEGLGQDHRFFRIGRLVIWIASNPDATERALEEVIEFYTSN